MFLIVLSMLVIGNNEYYILGGKKSNRYILENVVDINCIIRGWFD